VDYLPFKRSFLSYKRMTDSFMTNPHPDVMKRPA
jgi:hypothetical protein